MSSTNFDLSIVIPCYNEEGNIPLIFNRLAEVIGEEQNVEVVLVNNGSTDNSQATMDSELSKGQWSYFQVVHVPKNQGYGHGILEGLRQARGQVLSWTHADMQTDPKDVLDAYTLFRNHDGKNIIVKGKRKKRSLLDAFFTWGMQMATWFLLKTYLDDINAQPKMFNREFYEKYIVDKAPLDFSLDLFLLYEAKKRGYKTLEIPVYFAKRIHGEAKGGGSWKTKFKLIKRTFAYILDLKKNLQAT